MKSLKNRYAIAGKGKKAMDKLYSYTKQADGDIRLIRPTNDIYVPKEFLEDIKFNLKNDRISKEKALEMLNLIDGLQP
jgi:hypothetical protein